MDNGGGSANVVFFKQISIIKIKVPCTQNTLAVKDEKKKSFTNKTSAFVSCTFCTPDRAIIREQGEKLFLCKG
jgi:hypothetical protein